VVNLSLIRSFFKNKLSVYSYQIWMYTPQDHQWSLIDRLGNQADSSPAVLSSLAAHHNYSPSYTFDNDQACLTLHYPDGHQIMICLFEMITPLDRDKVEFLYHILFPLYTQQVLKFKEVELTKLIQGVQDITASLDLDNLLSKILDNVATVIPGADTAALWLYDPAIDRLVCKSFKGWKEDIRRVRYRIGESVTGKTFLDGKLRIFRSFRAGMAAMKGTSERNLRYLRNAFHHRKIKASVTVPISIRDETIGILGIHQADRERELTEWDLQLLLGLSAQIAIAIENARLFTEVTRKNQVLTKRNEVHATLTQLSLQNKGVESIAQELNRMIGMPLLFVDLLEDEHFPKGREGHSLRFSMDELTKLFSERTVSVYVDLVEKEKQSFYLYPIIVGSVCFGCLIVSTRRLLTQMDHMILEQGGSVLALELVKKQSLTDVYYKKTHDFFTQLLRNEDSNVLYTKGLDLGIDLHSHLISVVLEISSYHDLQMLEASVHRLVSRIKQKLTDVQNIAFGFHNKVTMLISLQDPASLPAVINTLGIVVKEWERSEGPPLCAGIGSLNRGISTISKTHTEANKALSYLISRHRTGLIQYSEIGINRLFLNQSTEEMDNFLLEIFAPLADGKARTNDLEKTLIVYVQMNRSASQSAEKLHIHINTLYQRLKKIEEILQLSLEEPEDILKIQLACHLRESYITGANT
jgi:sugar diacid utilization regulator